MTAHLMPRTSAPTTSHPYSNLHALDGGLHQGSEIFPRQLLCGYRSKVCSSLRARKRNGSLHRFCEFHRQQANTNQKKWIRRRFGVGTARGEKETPLDEPQLSFHELLAFQQQSYDCDAILLTDVVDTHHVGHQAWIPRDPEVEIAPLLATAGDADALWEALGLNELTSETEFVF